MGKTIRPTYPKEVSIGVLILIFIVSYILSHQVFDVPFSELDESKGIYFGMFLVSVAVLIMILIMWEEILFPIKLKEVKGGVIFRNHRTKLKAQLFIYCFIPAIFGFIYFEYEVNHFRFFIWAAVCMGLPVIEKIFSGINNYNDFLKLSDETIEYKNNEKEGIIKTTDIQNISIIRDETQVITKIQLDLKNNGQVIIDLDEMELEDFYDSIKEFIDTHYKSFLK